MDNMHEIEKLLKSEKGQAIKGLADSPEAKILSGMIDVKSVEKAAANGDMETLRGVLASVLKTDEGKKLAEKLRQM